MRDLIIIGAGTVGSFVARAASKYKLNILVIEKENDVGNITSNANSAIIHSGYDPLPGTNKAKFNVLGNIMFPKLCEELDVKFKQIGSLTIAKTKEEFDELPNLKERSLKNGVDVQILSKDETLALEPNLNKNIYGSLFAPTAGIVDPFNLVVHAIENAIDNGVELHLNESFVSFTKNNDFYTVKTSKGTYETRCIINCAGLHSDTLFDLSPNEKFEITPRKGQYFVLDHFNSDFIKHTIFPMPSKKGKGILVSPTSSGNYIVGPSSEEAVSKEDFGCDLETLRNIRKQASELVDNIPFNETVRVFAGLRATPSTHDFVIKELDNFEGVFVCGGIESPGLVSSPAIGEYVVNELVSKRITLIKNEKFNPYVKKYVHLNELSIDEKNKLIKENPDYGQIICNCEQVSVGEIKDLFKRSLVPNSFKGIKKRSRAGFGKCQSSFCQTRITLLLAKELGISLTEANYDSQDSAMVKEILKQIR